MTLTPSYKSLMVMGEVAIIRSPPSPITDIGTLNDAAYLCTTVLRRKESYDEARVRRDL